MTLRPKPSAKRLEIEHLRPRAIKPRARNPRTHSQAQIGKLMEAIRKFGFTAPGSSSVGQLKNLCERIRKTGTVPSVPIYRVT